MNALIIVDVQNDFLPGGALPVPEGDRVIPVINHLQPLFSCIVATKDWHPADHGSFAANHPGSIPGDSTQLNGLPQTLWPVHCVQGTSGAQFAAQLQLDRIDRVFQKGTDRGIDSYSGFFDNGHRQATGLGDYLRQRRVRDVFVAGLATDYCVKYTALDARRLGFQTFLIEDACRGVQLSQGDIERALDELREAGVRIIHSQDVGSIVSSLPADRQMEVIAQGRHLQLASANGWEFVRRPHASGVVIVAALTRDGKLLLIEQYRPAVDALVVELPAGLSGDSPQDRDEPLQHAAVRELIEETGYEPGSLQGVLTAASSAGLTDERVAFFVALDAHRVEQGGGVDGENITVHEVPLDEVDHWLAVQSTAGRLIDARVLAGIYLLRQYLAKAMERTTNSL